MVVVWIMGIPIAHYGPVGSVSLAQVRSLSENASRISLQKSMVLAVANLEGQPSSFQRLEYQMHDQPKQRQYHTLAKGIQVS